MSLSKTLSSRDLRESPVRETARALRRFGWDLFWAGEPFAVNGVCRRRFRIRWNKLWEYSRALAHVPWQPGWRAIDFGGGATLPVYYLASQGVEVESYDIDAELTSAAQVQAGKRQWPLIALSRDLTTDPLPDRERFDWAMSFCVLEHLPRAAQLQIAGHLADVLKPGGYLTVTFDYSPDAPVEGALRSLDDVKALWAATGLEAMDGQPFHDTRERFQLDRKYPKAKFTFGSLFLRKVGG